MGLVRTVPGGHSVSIGEMEMEEEDEVGGVEVMVDTGIELVGATGEAGAEAFFERFSGCTSRSSWPRASPWWCAGWCSGIAGGAVLPVKHRCRCEYGEGGCCTDRLPGEWWCGTEWG